MKINSLDEADPLSKLGAKVEPPKQATEAEKKAQAMRDFETRGDFRYFNNKWLVTEPQMFAITSAVDIYMNFDNSVGGISFYATEKVDIDPTEAAPAAGLNMSNNVSTGDATAFGFSGRSVQMYFGRNGEATPFRPLEELKFPQLTESTQAAIEESKSQVTTWMRRVFPNESEDAPPASAATEEPKRRAATVWTNPAAVRAWSDAIERAIRPKASGL